MKFILLLIVFYIVSFGYDNFKYIGNPYKKRYKNDNMSYARNIWDMQLYDGKIYLGAGNSSNKPPAPNAGRVPVLYYDLNKTKFYKEYTVAEEQINLYKVYDDTLFIPGHDATQKWTFGNFYEKQKNKKWKKYRTIPKALHVYDIVKKDNTLYVGVGLQHSGAVFYSTDKQKWKLYKVIPHKRVYGIVDIDNEIITDRDIVLSKDKVSKILKLNKHSFLYIKAKKHNDHQFKPIALYKAILQDNHILSTKVNLQGFLPFDIIKDDKIYILANKKDEIAVFRYDNLSKIISFRYNTFARSFEKYKNCFYFGMGSFSDDVKKETGDILKVCKDIKGVKYE